MKKSVKNIFEAKVLQKPGGQIYRTIAALPKHISVDDIIEYANSAGFGHRVENGVIRIFTPS